jgi:hypothetical protein
MGAAWDDISMHLERTMLDAAAEPRDEDEPQMDDGLGSMAMAMAEAVAGKEDGRLAQIVAFNQFLRTTEQLLRESNSSSNT